MRGAKGTRWESAPRARGLGIELQAIRADRVLEDRKLLFRRGRQLGRIEFVERRLPLHVKTLEPRDAIGGNRDRRLLGVTAASSPSASAPTPEIIARQQRPIRRVAQGHEPHFALRGEEQWA